MRGASGFQRRNEPGRGRMLVCNCAMAKSDPDCERCLGNVLSDVEHTRARRDRSRNYLGMATIFIPSPMSGRLLTPLIQNPRDNVICLSPKNRIFVVPS